MRCKLNDLCYIKKSLREPNIGLVVRCKRYLGYYERGATIVISGESFLAFDTDDFWLIENDYGEIESHFGRAREGYIMDSWLEPIAKLENDSDADKKIIEHVGTDDDFAV